MADDSEGGNISIRKSSIIPKKKILKLAEMSESLAPVEWGPNRPRPEVSLGLWREDEAEELAKYIDWHHRHPHCITPRKILEEDGQIMGRQKLDEDNPGKFYTANGIKVAPVPKQYFPTKLGLEGDMDEVSVSAYSSEYRTHVRQQAEDPWFTMSVKDQLESSHMDGSHTTVKYKPPKTREERERERQVKVREWAKPRFEGYEGGLHPHEGPNARPLELLALSDHERLSKPKVKVGPWAETYVFSQYTRDGTALKSFQRKDLENKVQYALTRHEEEVRLGIIRTPSATPSGKRRSKKSKKQAILKADPYEVLKEKLGGAKKLLKMEKGWLRTAKDIRKHSNKKKNEVDTKIDLVEACEKLRVLKVAALLFANEGGHANMKTPEDEPLFLHTIARAIKMDQVTNSLRPEDEANDTSDRKKLQKILNLLVKYGANVNMMTGKESIAAVHMAAGADNSKMIKWLVEQKANVNILGNTTDNYSALMIGAKYCYVHVLAMLTLQNCDLNAKQRDGWTALHIAAKFGQTRSALFLLRVGADKKLKDNSDRTPALLAQEERFMGTSQAIASFTPATKEYKEQLQFMIHEHERIKNQPPIETIFGSFLDNIFAGAMDFLNKSTSLFKVIKDYFKKKLHRYRHVRIFPQQDTDDDSEDDDEDDELQDGNVEELDAKLKAMEAHMQMQNNPDLLDMPPM